MPADLPSSSLLSPAQTCSTIPAEANGIAWTATELAHSSLLSAICNRFAEFKPRPDPSNADASHGAFGVSAAGGRCAPRWWPQCHGRFIGHTDHRNLLVEPTPSECLRTTSGPGSQEAGVEQYWPRAVRLHSVRSRGRPTEPSDPPERHEHLESFTRSPLISPAWSSNDPELCLVSHSNSRLTSCPLSPIFKFYVLPVL